MAETKKVTRKAKKESVDMNISVYDLTGKEVKQLTLSEEMFAADINPQVLAQYVRVYLANQRQGTASTKHRSEVVGTTKKYIVKKEQVMLVTDLKKLQSS